MHPSTIAYVAGLGLSLTACNAVINPTQIADVACIVAQAGSAIGAAAADANAGTNGTNAAVRAQKTTTTTQKLVANACPIIETSADLINSASSLSAGK